MDEADDDEFWQGLLDKIERRTVVPVIGPDLIEVDGQPDGRPPRRFVDLLADRLNEKLTGLRPTAVRPCPTCGQAHAGADNDDDHRPVDVDELLRRAGHARKYFRGNPDTFGKDHVLGVVRQLEQEIIDAGRVPRPLRQLAEIPNFDLYVTTTFDGLFERALADQVGPAAVAAFARGSADDSVEAVRARRSARPDATLLVYLFGRARPLETFAYAEAQFLHQVHALIADAEKSIRYTPQRLAVSDLLFVGVSFPDWLARFLIKAARGRTRLWNRDNDADTVAPDEFIVNSTVPPHGLESFLKLFMQEKTRTLREPMSCAAFVDRLHAEWFRRHPARRPPPITPAEAPAAGATPAGPRRVFVSYSHEGNGSGHMARVADLVAELRHRDVAGRLEIILDVEQKFPLGPDETWGVWSCNWARKADRILCVGSASYYSAWHRERPPSGGGLGAAAEASYIRTEIYHDRQQLRRVPPGPARLGRRTGNPTRHGRPRHPVQGRPPGEARQDVRMADPAGRVGDTGGRLIMVQAAGPSAPAQPGHPSGHPSADAPPGESLSAERPWPGPRAFGYDDRAFFCGRSADVAELAGMVRRVPALLLYGQSGTGKTSLLQAGLVPELARTGWLPVVTRIDYGRGAPPVGEQLLDRLREAIASARAAGDGRRGSATPARRVGVGVRPPSRPALPPARWPAAHPGVGPRPVRGGLHLGRWRGAASRAHGSSSGRSWERCWNTHCPTPSGGSWTTRTTTVAANPGGSTWSGPTCGWWSACGRTTCRTWTRGRRGCRRCSPSGTGSARSPGRRRWRSSPSPAVRWSPRPSPPTSSPRSAGSRPGTRGSTAAVKRRPTGPEAAGDPVEPFLLSLTCYKLNEKRLAKRAAQLTSELVEAEGEQILTEFYDGAFAGTDPMTRAYVEEHLVTPTGPSPAAGGGDGGAGDRRGRLGHAVRPAAATARRPRTRRAGRADPRPAGRPGRPGPGRPPRGPGGRGAATAGRRTGAAVPGRAGRPRAGHVRRPGEGRRRAGPAAAGRVGPRRRDRRGHGRPGRPAPGRPRAGRPRPVRPGGRRPGPGRRDGPAAPVRPSGRSSPGCCSWRRATWMRPTGC